jgi:succinyl-CoA synthetase beta subunit
MRKAAHIFMKIYQLFIEKDSSMIEINPLAELNDGEVMCMDAKFGFDDNAEFRQKDVFAMRDKSQEDAREVSAAEWDLVFLH